jgi:hypothetical protein
VPFGVRQIRSVSHPQGTAGICLHCTYKNADFIGTILSFQTGSYVWLRLKGHCSGPDRTYSIRENTHESVRQLLRGLPKDFPYDP